jgi:hypothetical protein
VNILFCCEVCVAHEIVPWSQGFADGWNKLFQSLPDAQLARKTPICPDGHGEMREVTSRDRISVRRFGEKSEATQ